jgi:hypothetical protein
MNVLTQKKINAIKEKIKNKVELKEIIKVHFGGSRPRLEQWLKEKFSSDFTQDELDYLEYVIIPEKVEDEEVKAFKEAEKIGIEEVEQVEEVQQNIITTIPTQNQISLMSRKDRENFLLSNLVIEKLVDLLTNNVKIAEKDEIVIADEVRDLKDLKIQNIRISEQIYKDFVSLCKKKGLTITSVINTMFLDFINKHK